MVPEDRGVLMNNVRSRFKWWVLKDYTRYKSIERCYRLFSRTSAAEPYPTDLNVELTSVCNSKCSFCTHETLIRNRLRSAEHMDFALAKTVLERLRQLVDVQNIPDTAVRLCPVGLGEPLLYPHFFEIVRYARELFPRAFLHINTNALILDEERATRLIECGLDQVIISLCYDDRDLYRERMGLDRYEHTARNIRNFLSLKGNRLPRAVIHIFDVPENRPNFTRFVERWAPLLGTRDFVGLYTYVPLVSGAIPGAQPYPCTQLLDLLMVSVDGSVFPCCVGVWRSHKDDLCIGNILDAPESLIEKNRALRERHWRGEYQSCQQCAFLYSDKNKAAYQRQRSRWERAMRA